MADFESLSSEDVFVADALSDLALHEFQAKRANVLTDAAARLLRGAGRPLTRAAQESAKNDPGLRPRVFAPASLRVPKCRLLADERFLAPETVATPPQVYKRSRAVVRMSSTATDVHVSCELVKAPV